MTPARGYNRETRRIEVDTQRGPLIAFDIFGDANETGEWRGRRDSCHLARAELAGGSPEDVHPDKT